MIDCSGSRQDFFVFHYSCVSGTDFVFSGRPPANIPARRGRAPMSGRDASIGRNGSSNSSGSTMPASIADRQSPGCSPEEGNRRQPLHRGRTRQV
ncbi:hypothetical protein CA13_58270 [Planctomycetes bacterium CA13]|uniref:Uncharacterized protein n=1 Tax=Novipirellula herctigrandis TaxID=2527986 RepID=A0A5C5ZAW3_9BACT|nr:hypothetical protein CA13_58270 [Planctomycetes bacterium CA13]